MNEKYLTELLNTYRTFRMGIWNAMLLSIGGTIGIFLKILSTPKPFFEIVLFITGLISTFSLFLIIQSFNEKIFKILDELKKEK